MHRSTSEPSPHTPHRAAGPCGEQRGDWGPGSSGTPGTLGLQPQEICSPLVGPWGWSRGPQNRPPRKGGRVWGTGTPQQDGRPPCGSWRVTVGGRGFRIRDGPSLLPRASEPSTLVPGALLPAPNPGAALAWPVWLSLDPKPPRSSQCPACQSSTWRLCRSWLPEDGPPPSTSSPAAPRDPHTGGGAGLRVPAPARGLQEVGPAGACRGQQRPSRLGAPWTGPSRLLLPASVPGGPGTRGSVLGEAPGHLHSTPQGGLYRQDPGNPGSWCGGPHPGVWVQMLALCP